MRLKGGWREVDALDRGSGGFPHHDETDDEKDDGTDETTLRRESTSFQKKKNLRFDKVVLAGYRPAGPPCLS